MRVDGYWGLFIFITIIGVVGTSKGQDPSDNAIRQEIGGNVDLAQGSIRIQVKAIYFYRLIWLIEYFCNLCRWNCITSELKLAVV